eukprot:2367570-Alexandrium_andersonii.AAC.1
MSASLVGSEMCIRDSSNSAGLLHLPTFNVLKSMDYPRAHAGNPPIPCSRPANPQEQGELSIDADGYTYWVRNAWFYFCGPKLENPRSGVIKRGTQQS